MDLEFKIMKLFLSYFFKTKGYDLDPGLILMMKLLIISVSFLNPLFPYFGTIFVGIIPFFDTVLLGASQFSGISLGNLHFIIKCAWKILFFYFSICVFMNRHLRLSLLALSALILWAIFVNELIYRNSLFYAAAMFLIVGVSFQHTERKFLIAQMAIVYFLSALAKVLEVGWRDGSFMQIMIRQFVYKGEFFLQKISYVLDIQLFLISISMLVIFIEFLLGIGLFFSKINRPLAVISFSFHSFLILITGESFVIFYYALLITLYSFIAIPDEIKISLPDKSRVREKLFALFKYFDFDQRWLMESPRRDSDKIFSLKIYEDQYKGFFALQKIFIYSPALLILCFLLFSLNFLPAWVRLFIIPVAIFILGFPFSIFMKKAIR